MFKVWCEFDIGLGNALFTTKEAAEKYIKDNRILESAGSEESYQELLNDGLIGFSKQEVLA